MIDPIVLCSFIGFTLFVAGYSWFKLRNESLDTREGYFLGGRSLTGLVIAGSMLLTNISTEHLIGMNGSSYRNGMIIIAWEVTSALALVLAAFYFIPIYLRMGLTTIPQYLEERFDGATRTLVAFFLIVSFVVTLLPIVLFTGAINLESLFDISDIFKISQPSALWFTVIAIGGIGSLYAIFGGLKAVAYSDSINGVGLLIGGLLVPIFALHQIGNGNLINGLGEVYHNSPDKFNVIGAADSVLPFGTLFTGLMINQLYFWGMNQTIIQRALGAKSLAEAQKGLLYTGVLKILIPFIIVLPGIIGFYYFGSSLFDNQDMVYPELVKKVMPLSLIGFFAAVVMGAVLSTFNSVLNSTATIFSEGIYKRIIKPSASDHAMVAVGKWVSALLAIVAILVAPMVANAPEGLYQLLQQLNGIFFIPIASIMLAGFFIPQITALAAKIALFFGLVFYISTTFIWPSSIHFVHIWGIEFVLNMLIMLGVSYVRPMKRDKQLFNNIQVELKPWRWTKPMSIGLIITIVLIYIWLGSV